MCNITFIAAAFIHLSALNRDIDGTAFMEKLL